MKNLISSQRYVDEDIVNEKIRAGDFDVYVTPEFEFEGELYRVLTDGHHSLMAAYSSGEKPHFIEQDIRDNDAIIYIEKGDIETFLEISNNGDDWYFVDTGKNVWQ